MRLGIVGQKIGMTQIFDENGANVPVTVLDTSECYITGVKTRDTHGYNALQIAFAPKKTQNLKKHEKGFFQKAGVPPKGRFIEFRMSAQDDLSQFKPGQRLNPAMFEKGDLVDAIGVSRGKGFQGVVKRHGFHGADATHGVHEYFRHGGSAGTNTFPGRILKNKGMPGQTGNANCTVQNIRIVEVRPEDNLILVRGAVPGARNGWVTLRSALKRKTPEGRTLVS